MAFDRIFRRSKMPHIRLTCRYCGRTYNLGRDAIVVTQHRAARGPNITYGDFYPYELMDTSRFPDLVDSCRWRSLEQSTIIEQMKELSMIKGILSKGEERWWQCNKCKGIGINSRQSYPPMKKPSGESDIESLKAAKDVGGLVKALKNKDEDVRWKAAKALGNIKESGASEPLIKALRDKDEDVRSGAAKALGKIKEPRSVEPLMKALRDKDEDVRYEAVIALTSIGDKKAVVPLIRSLRDEYCMVRYNATEALAKMGDETTVELLTKTLNDRDEEVQKNAKNALKRIKARLRRKQKAINST